MALEYVPLSLERARELYLGITYLSPYQNVEVNRRSRRMDKGKGKSRRAEIVDDCCGRWRGDDCDRRRETVVVGSDGSNSILVVNKSLRCIHATAMQRVLLLNARICGWRKWVPMDKE